MIDSCLELFFFLFSLEYKLDFDFALAKLCSFWEFQSRTLTLDPHLCQKSLVRPVSYLNP